MEFEALICSVTWNLTVRANWFVWVSFKTSLNSSQS
ncbi:hypothetical protein CIPAW_06G152300 [Carya illinoinensis]|uniref:Uncharacterized protein n=1 Tax=Carya illinoinensis TaxID=32201 RepID=A0A8T1QC64_CARIL|nr:hypothetical protein CIPAW_06G152300 [Carya illinoinensis]